MRKDVSRIVRVITTVRSANHIVALAALTMIVYFVFQLQNGRAETKQPFSSTKGTVFDIIRASDESTFSCLEYIGRGDRRIRDKRVNGEPIVNAFLFVARYKDGANFEIRISPEFDTLEKAKAEALRFAYPLGQLPTLLRAGIRRFSVHMGRKGFHAGRGGIIAYSGSADQRASYNHLEETLFHEAVHASLDDDHRLSDGWRRAQASDGQFLTSYAAGGPEREDLAETALFAFAILHHPARFPPADTEATMRAVPHRIEYIKGLFPPGKPLVYSIGNAQKCQ
jgi:hypothetical protein